METQGLGLVAEAEAGVMAIGLVAVKTLYTKQAGRGATATARQRGVQLAAPVHLPELGTGAAVEDRVQRERVERAAPIRAVLLEALPGVRALRGTQALLGAEALLAR